MQLFSVLSLGGFIDQQSMKTAIKAFAELYHNQTPKHKKNLSLTIIEEENVLELRNQIIKEGVQLATKIINRADIKSVEQAYNTASIFLFPSYEKGYKLICEALSFGLPILTFEHIDITKILDETCSMTIKDYEEPNVVETFSNMLEMLYYDPEVRKLLEKGAEEKYKKEFKWTRSGRERQRKAS